MQAIFCKGKFYPKCPYLECTCVEHLLDRKRQRHNPLNRIARVIKRITNRAGRQYNCILQKVSRWRKP